MLNRFKRHCLYFGCIQSPASALFRLGASNLWTLTLFELSRRRQIQRVCVWCLSRNHQHTSPSSYCFPFWDLQYEKIKMTQSVSFFVSKSISTLKAPYMKLGAFHSFDCPVSFHGDEVVQSQVDSQLRCVELWANLVRPPWGGQEERIDSEIN